MLKSCSRLRRAITKGVGAGISRIKTSVGALSFDWGWDEGTGGPNGMLDIVGFRVMLKLMLCCIDFEGSAPIAMYPDGQ